MEVPRYWRTNQQRYRLTGSICSSCNEPSFPPRDICPHCDGESQTQYASRGEVVAYSRDVLPEASPSDIKAGPENIEAESKNHLIYQAAD